MGTIVQQAWIGRVLNVSVLVPRDEPPATTAKRPGAPGDWLAKRKQKKAAKKAAAAPQLTSHQKQVADKKLDALDANDKAAFQKLLTDAGSDAERVQLNKALATDHSLQEISDFATTIKGKDEKWMDKNLKVAAKKDGTGIQQQFVMSCPSTTVQAVKGTLDPIYALQLNQEGDISKVRKDVTGPMAAEQKTLLETVAPDGDKGRAVPLRGKQKKTDEGEGRFNDDLLNNMADVTGIKYTPTNVKMADMDKHTTKIANSLRDGKPVPLVVGGKEGDPSHYVLATRVVQDKKGTEKFEIHDVGSGKTVYRTAKDFADGDLKLPSGWSHLARYEAPS